MPKDYYKILGIQKSASKDEIKKAFRKLAMEHHPDKGGNEAKFKEINEAYTVLSDENKRAQYDQFGNADFNGGGFGGGQGQGFGGFDFSGFSNAQGMEFDLGDIFNQFFGGRSRRHQRGANIQVDLDLDFKESILGAKKKVSFFKNRSNQKTELELQIPAGVDNGETLSVRGGGEPSPDEGGQPGDLLVVIHVKTHPKIHKRGIHLVQPLEISISEAILGTKKEIDTIDGKIKIKIPAGSNTGDVLNVKGEGVKIGENRRGDMLVGIKINIPDKVSNKVKKILEDLGQEGL